MSNGTANAVLRVYDVALRQRCDITAKLKRCGKEEALWRTGGVKRAKKRISPLSMLDGVACDEHVEIADLTDHGLHYSSHMMPHESRDQETAGATST